MKNFVLIPIKHKKENKHHRGIFVLQKVRFLLTLGSLKKKTPEEIFFYKDCHMSKTGVIQSSVRY